MPRVGGVKVPREGSDADNAFQVMNEARGKKMKLAKFVDAVQETLGCAEGKAKMLCYRLVNTRMVVQA